jgi:hypothetical protein
MKSSNIAAIENILIGLLNEIVEDGTEFTLVLEETLPWILKMK